jgi:hypothetical protein
MELLPIFISNGEFKMWERKSPEFLIDREVIDNTVCFDWLVSD